MNIVVVVAGGISETLQATPLLRTLRAGEPSAQITLICPLSAQGIAAGVPAVDAVVALRALEGTPRPGAAAKTWWELRRRRVDAVLLCSNRASLRLAAFLAGVPERFGPGGGISLILLTGRSHGEPDENRSPAWLRLASLAGIRQELHAPQYEPGAEALREADRLIHGSGLADGRLLVALAPGPGFAEIDGELSNAISWDGERYALLANQLALRHGAGILFLGTQTDRPVVEQTMLDLGASAVDLSGQLDLQVVAAILARCDLLVGGDTPLLHLAAAVGTPAVGLFGPTDGRRRGPYGSDHRIIQGVFGDPSKLPATDGAIAPSVMDQIRVEDVLASIEAAL
jgi:ADP-heptose:LPS heptosyltransferase